MNKPSKDKLIMFSTEAWIKSCLRSMQSLYTDQFLLDIVKIMPLQDNNAPYYN
ncbi:MAG TPA: hypothetical protein VK250_02845 [Nitrososphaeraceae archaeon]|nr:hypothetical protein [Nitrososphaeraceae archaeon]